MNRVKLGSEPRSIELPRRNFMRAVVLGAGTTVLSSMLPGSARGAGKTEALLLSCMDFRLMDDIERYMAGRELRDKYDHIVLAGASLGALTDKYPAWSKTFWDHVGLAVDLHHIEKVIVMDHRDCGAYKVMLGEDFAKDPAKETQVHSAELRQLAASIKKQHPKLAVETLLMSLDGEVEAIA